MNDHEQAPKAREHADADKAALEAEPNWDRMGQIARRLMATPPGQQKTTANLAPKKLKP
ncbi:hypothetical protein ACFZ8E_01150 [Methylobacterium sp. HMF5984]|uniref:hypothetical protein n=1 Tax=Methylobacterium sp. HMF5984 TaxID=3367370 RepID=UPI003853654A